LGDGEQRVALYDEGAVGAAESEASETRRHLVRPTPLLDENFMGRSPALKECMCFEINPNISCYVEKFVDKFVRSKFNWKNLNEKYWV
jgi:hypothetical protein